MRKWLVPLIAVGAGGLGAFLLSDKGRATLRRRMLYLGEAPESWDEWNAGAQSELQRIQDALNQIAQTLEPRGEAGR